jgi:hypothetical protein
MNVIHFEQQDLNIIRQKILFIAFPGNKFVEKKSIEKMKNDLTFQK